MEHNPNDNKIRKFVEYTNGELSSSERINFEIELKNSMQLRREFEDFNKLWKDLDKLNSPEINEIEQRFGELKSKLKSTESINSITEQFISKNLYHKQIFNNKREFYGWTVRFAALLLMSILSYQILLVNQSAKSSQTEIAQTQEIYNHYTQRGEKSEISLPDGSKVYLNSSSHLTYNSDFNNSNRNVHLEGEAFFEVASNEITPFVVTTELNKVKVVGTKFNIYNRNKEFVVAVTEGKVIAIQEDGRSVDLVKNQVAEMKENNILVKSTNVDLDQFIGWRNNKLNFRNDPLYKVMDDIEITFNVNAFF
ncbi:MAG: FecR family protein [Melioribacteraceae bacterium]|nr:FecR family protein [Melioribacteraceae bacterium]